MRDKQHSVGSVDDMIRAMQNRLEDLEVGMSTELNTDYTAAEPIQSANAVDRDDSGMIERYLHVLVGDVQAELSDEIQNMVADYDDNDLKLVVTYSDNTVREFTITFDEFSFDFDEMDEDVQFVVNTILYDLDTYDESVED